MYTNTRLWTVHFPTCEILFLQSFGLIFSNCRWMRIVSILTLIHLFSLDFSWLRGFEIEYYQRVGLNQHLKRINHPNALIKAICPSTCIHPLASVSTNNGKAFSWSSAYPHRDLKSSRKSGYLHSCSWKGLGGYICEISRHESGSKKSLLDFILPGIRYQTYWVRVAHSLLPSD